MAQAFPLARIRHSVAGGAPGLGNGSRVDSSYARTLPTILLVAAAIVLGGGGSNAPGWELALELVCAAILGVAAFVGGNSGNRLARPATGRAALLLAGLVLALPVLQLVPLPPAIWHGLPGRTAEIAVLALADAQDRWMPWSMTPSRTLAALLAMCVPATVMVMVARLDLAGRTRVLEMVSICAIASVMLGTLQMADGEGGRWRLQSETHLGYLTGFHANRNHQADLLLIALLAVAACWTALRGRASSTRQTAGGPGIRRIGLTLAPAMLLFGLVMTGSGAGLVMLVPVLLALLAIIRPREGWGNSRRLLGIGAVATVLAAAVLMQVPSIQRVATRFVTDGANRTQLWADTRKAIGLYWPAGTGLGSFEPIFISSESLEYVDTTLPVRAHSDWLEFTLEAGAGGWLVLIVVLGLLVWNARSALARSSAGTAHAMIERGQLLFALASLTVLALHSIVDYPLRSMSLACLAAVAAAMLFKPAPGPGVPPNQDSD